jgi:hypothetical protein
MSVMRNGSSTRYIHVYLYVIGEARAVSRYRQYTVHFVKGNGEARLHCYGRNCYSSVKRNYAFDYGMNLEA